MSFRICLIGCGNLANSQHGPAVKKYETLHPGVRFAACCDIDKEKARDFKEKFALDNYYTDINSMLDAEKPDAVSLIAPEVKMAELSIQILEKGFPLLLEKPPGLTPQENDRMVKAAGSTPNMVAFNRRYMPIVQKCMAWLKEIDAKITHIHYRTLRVNRTDASFSTTAIHGIDLTRHIAKSNYKNLSFSYKDFPKYGKTVSNFHLDGEMESGALVHLDFLPISGINTERIEINTDKGIFFANLPIWKSCHDGSGKLCYVQNDEVKEIDALEAARSCVPDGSCEEFVLGGFYSENEKFFNDVRNGRKSEGDIASGYQAVEIAGLIERREAKYGY